MISRECESPSPTHRFDDHIPTPNDVSLRIGTLSVSTGKSNHSIYDRSLVTASVGEESQPQSMSQRIAAYFRAHDKTAGVLQSGPGAEGGMGAELSANRLASPVEVSDSKFELQSESLDAQSSNGNSSAYMRPGYAAVADPVADHSPATKAEGAFAPPTTNPPSQETMLPSEDCESEHRSRRHTLQLSLDLDASLRYLKEQGSRRVITPHRPASPPPQTSESPKSPRQLRGERQLVESPRNHGEGSVSNSEEEAKEKLGRRVYDDKTGDDEAINAPKVSALGISRQSSASSTEDTSARFGAGSGQAFSMVPQEEFDVDQYSDPGAGPGADGSRRSSAEIDLESLSKMSPYLSEIDDTNI